MTESLPGESQPRDRVCRSVILRTFGTLFSPKKASVIPKLLVAREFSNRDREQDLHRQRTAQSSKRTPCAPSQKESVVPKVCDAHRDSNRNREGDLQRPTAAQSHKKDEFSPLERVSSPTPHTPKSQNPLRLMTSGRSRECGRTLTSASCLIR